MIVEIPGSDRRCWHVNDTQGYQYFPERCIRPHNHKGPHRSATWTGDTLDTIWWEQ